MVSWWPLEQEFRTLSHAEYSAVLRFREAIWIHNKKPTFNKQWPDLVDLLHRCPVNFQRLVIDNLPTICAL